MVEGMEVPLENVASPKVSIIILNWNGLTDTVECLESLKKITYPNYEVTVVDNGSQGNDADVLQEKFGDYIHLIRNDKNYGYTGGNNIGIGYALQNSQPDCLLLLNNDVVVAPDFLDLMIRAVQGDPSIGVAGPKVYYYDSPSRIQSAGAKIKMITGQTYLIGNKQIDNGQCDQRRDVDYVSGCCMLLRKELIQQIGLFDESYFCYWDETDYCVRASKAGFRIVYVPDARVWHKNPFGLRPWYKTLRKKHQPKISLSSTYLMTRNNFRFMRKYATRVQFCSFLAYFFGYRLWFVTGVCALFYRDIGQVIAFYRAIKDGLLNRTDGAKAYIRS